MANRFYVTIRGAVQGQFKGDDVRSQQGNKIAGLAFRYGVTSPRDPQGMATGRQQHDAVLLVKEWVASSPQIFQAIATNEVITEVNFEFLKTTPAGQDSLYYTIKLTNASIVKVSMHVDAPTPGAAGDTRELEEVSFLFQKIEMANLDGGTAGADDARGINGVSTAPPGRHSRGSPLADRRSRKARDVSQCPSRSYRRRIASRDPRRAERPRTPNQARRASRRGRRGRSSSACRRSSAGRRRSTASSPRSS
jgi:type VI secretion system secreted protein Hcp